jgi:ubiquinone/menaquinone biosynthesis C-methylase UbiE
LENFKFQGSPCTLLHETTIKKRALFIQDKLKFNKNQLILDIGIGFGIYTNYLLNISPNYIGLDVDRNSLKKTLNTCDRTIDCIQMSAEKIGFKENTFDAILLIEVLEHIPDNKKALCEINRILKPGGRLILTAPNKLFPMETHGMRIGYRNISSHGFGIPLLPYLPIIFRKYVANAKVFSTSEITKLLESSGFQTETRDFLMPSLDQIQINFNSFKTYIKLIRKILLKIEKSSFNNFSETIIICAIKVVK